MLYQLSYRGTTPRRDGLLATQIGIAKGIVGLDDFFTNKAGKCRNVQVRLAGEDVSLL